MEKYDRYVYIVLRDGQVRAVISRAQSARDSLQRMRDNNMPAFDPNGDYEEYMKECQAEHAKWRLERWPIVASMAGL